MRKFEKQRNGLYLLKIDFDDSYTSTGILKCCATYGIQGFWYDHQFSEDYWREYGCPDLYADEETYLKYLEWDIREVLRIGKANNKSVVVAITNSEQKIVTKLFKEIGFRSTNWISRPIGDNNPKIKIHTYYLAE